MNSSVFTKLSEALVRFFLPASIIRRLMAALIALYMSLSFASKPTAYEPLEAEPVASLAVMADLHTESTEPWRFELISAGFADVRNAARCDALVLNGDSVMNGQEIENMCLFGLLKSTGLCGKAMPVAGNHELGGSDGGYEQRANRFIAFRNIFTQHRSDKIYYSADINGCRVLVLGSEADAGVQAYFSPEQLKWVDEQLDAAAASKLPSLVFCHQPFDGTFNSAWNDGHVGEQGEELFEILREHKNVFYFSGHLHMGLVEKSAYTVDGVTLVNIPCYSGSLYGKNTQSGTGYVVEVYDEKVVLRARNFKDSQWLEDYEYTFATSVK